MVNQSLQKTKLNNNEIQETIIAVLSHDTREDQADALGISRQALYKRLVNNPEIDEFINSLGKIAQQNLQIASIKAAQKLVELIDDYDPKISMKASIEVLDRVSTNGKGDGNIDLMQSLKRDAIRFGIDG